MEDFILSAFFRPLASIVLESRAVPRVALRHALAVALSGRDAARRSGPAPISWCTGRSVGGLGSDIFLMIPEGGQISALSQPCVLLPLSKGTVS